MRRTLVASAGALALCAASPVQAEVVMQDGHGRVEVLPEGGGKGVGILPGEKLGAGTLSVGPKAQATFKTPAGTVELDGAARAKVADDKVSLEAGSVQANAAGKPLVIEASSGLSASGSGKFEVALVGSKTRVTSREGAVQLAFNGSKQELASGKSIELGKNDALADAPAAEAKPEPAKPEAEKPEPAKPSKPSKPVEVAAAEEKPAPEAAKPEAPKPEEAPAPTPPKLTIKWPSGSVGTSWTLKGQVTPGATVMVNDVAAQVRKNGSFSIKLTLPEGESSVSVKASANGLDASDEHAVTAAPPPPKPAASTDGDSGDKPDKGTKPQVKQEAAGWE